MCVRSWTGPVLLAALALSVVAPVRPADAANDGSPQAAANPVDPAALSAPEPKLIRFNFKGASFEQVIDFFARATGLPVVWETDPPQGTLDYLSPESYELGDALRILNIILQSKGVMLRANGEMLYLQKLTEMQKEDIPTYVGEIPTEVTDDQIITVVRPLEIAMAKPLAERLSTMVAAYGSVTAMEQQNALVITETAAQVRRLDSIIQELDREDPEGVIEIIPIRHTEAKALMEPLRALLSQRVEKYVVNQKGQQVKIEEDQMPGLNITFDERTNVIVAKGLQNRIDKLKEAVELLDVPNAGTSRTVRTFSLQRLAPREAVATLNQLFSKTPDPEKPTLLPLEDVGKLTIVGTEAAVLEAADLLREVDGGGAAQPSGDGDGQIISVIAIDQADPSALIDALRQLLTPRQQSVLKLLVGPDGRSLIVSGPNRDVEAVKAITPVLDVPRRVDRQVRLVRITTPDPAQTLARARTLYQQQIEAGGRADDPEAEISAELDTASRQLTLIGSSRALERFTSTLRTVEENVVIDRETRQIELANAEPSRIVPSLTNLSRQLLQPRDGRAYTPPTIEPVDELDLLIITAQPEQFGVINSLVGTLDRVDPSAYEFRVIPLQGVSNVEELRERAGDAYKRLTAEYDPDELPDPTVEHDTVTGNLIVSGRANAVRLYERAVSEARRLLPPARTGRMIALRQAKASDVVAPLRELLEKTAPEDASRTVPAATIEAIDRTNSLFVTAEPAQHQMIERLVRELDTFEQIELPPLKLIQVRAADASQLASMLRKRYDARPQAQRREMPVTIDADAATNTLIVTAHTDVFDEIKEFVDGVNRAGETVAERQTMIFPLKRSRATDLAAALEKLYPEPPMPVDRRGRPMPQLREPKEVYVSADAATNTLIIEAPAERRASFDALVEQLDRVELPPRAELRTYHIERGDPELIARTLTELARRGVMSDQPADGSKPVEVLVQAETKSRTLIVAGDEVTFAKTEAMLSDLQAVPVQRSLRVFEVLGADPQEIADRAKRLYAEQTSDDPNARPVDVEVDPSSGSLLVVAEDEAMIVFAQILNQLEQTIGSPPDVRLVPLEFVEASEVVAFLRDLVDSSQMMLGKRMGPPPTFEAIERTNSVLIAAQSDQHEIIRALISGLDQIEPKAMPPLRILQLRTADAGNLADALQRQYNQRPVEERTEKPVTITADAQTNALMVAAHPDLVAEIEAIVSELNAANRIDTEGREIRIFPLKVARAEELARTIDEMFPEPPAPVDRRGRPMPHLRPQREVVIRADPQTNSIIVDAPIQRLAGFEQLVEQLDRAKLTDDTEIRTYRVVHADLNTLSSTLDKLASAGSLNPSGQDRRVPITISTEPVSRTLIVSGPIEIFERVEQVLDDLDADRVGPETTLRFFKLEHARADSLVPMLQQILLSRMSEEVPEAGADAQTLLNVTADKKTNTLIISAPAALLPVAEELVNQLDDSTASIGEPTIRIRPLTFADATEVSRSLSSALPNMISKATGEPIDVRLIAAPGSNAVILVGLEQDLTEVEALIDPLDARPSMDAMDARTFKLANADATEIADIVQNLLTNQQANDPRLIIERIRRSRGAVEFEPRIRVEADARTNSLIVSGPQRTVALAETLIEQMDRDDERAERIYDSFTPVKADAVTLAQSALRVLEAARTRPGRAKLELIPEPNTGTIVIIGTAGEVAEAMELLAKRDERTLTPPQMDLRIVALEHSDANVVARTISPMLADQSRWPTELRSLARAGIAIGRPTITADAADNRLLVSAPKELMPIAQELIDQLDRPRDDEAAVDVRIFTLAQTDASGVADALRSALSSRASRRPGEMPPTIAPESSSNSVIVTATADQMTEIESMIEELDAGYSADQAQVRTVFLKHARAESVAPIVEQLLQGEEIPIWLVVDIARRGRDMPDTGPDVRVAADERLNAVVISAPPAVLNIAEEMVAQLDVDPGLDPSLRRSVRVLVVRNADASEIATNVQELFDEPVEGEAPPTIRVDRASNSLLVRATESQFEMIQRVVSEVDQVTLTTARQMQTITIDPSKASAQEVARTLQRLLDRTGGSRVEVITLDELLKRREAEEPPEPPSGASSALPHPFAPVIAAAFALPADAPGSNAEEGETRAAAESLIDAGRDVTIAVDPATNSLIVVGAPRIIERLTALAQQIQDQIPAEPGRVRYVAMPDETDARTLAQLVNQTLRQLTPPGGRQGDLFRRSSVLADVAGNALVIACNDTDFETIGELIAAMARPPAAEQVIVKVYPLETITAERAASSVEQLLEPDQRGRRPRGRQAERMRSLAVKLLAGEKAIDAVFNPTNVRVAPDAQTNSLIVMGPGEAIGFIDQYIELIDQSPVNTQTTLKLFPLRHARATDLQGTLRQIFRSRYRSMSRQPGMQIIEPDFGADDRTNTLIVTAAPEQLVEVEALLDQLDRELGEDVHALRIIELDSALPSQAAQLLDRVVVGTDQNRRATTQIVADDQSGVLLVRASDEVNAEIDEVLTQIDRDATSEFEVRTIVLERADAQAVAEAVQQFFDDRARIASAGRGRRAQTRRVSVVGHSASNTLLVAASDEDFEEIKALVEQFDSPQATDVWTFRVFQLQHARATEIESTVQDLISDLTWGQGPFFFFNNRFMGPGGGRNRGTIAVRADARMNALIVTGEGDKFDLIQQLIDVLDAPPSEGAERIVRLYRLRNADLDVVGDVIVELFADPNRQRRWWMPPDPNEIRVRTDDASNTLIISATGREHEEITALIASIEEQVTTPDQETTVLSVEFAQARDVERSLTRFLEERAEAAGLPRSTATIIASQSANSLVVSAAAEEMAMIRDLLAQIDQPDVSGDRDVEIIALRDGDADEIGRIIRDQFGRRGGGGQGVVVTSDARTNSLIVNAPQRQLAQVRALIEQLDSPRASDETIIRTYSLKGAQAEEAVRILSETLQLDSRGETRGITIKLDEADEAVEVNAKIVADRRSNSLIVTATAESFPVIESLVKQIDEVPAASPIEYRIVTLKHALADDVAYTLGSVGAWGDDGGPRPSFDYNLAENQLIIAATADQYEQIDTILEQIDQPSERTRTTEFIPLEFAEAEKVQEALSVFYGPYAMDADTPGKRNVRIVADPATNSLVISADEAEWANVRALLNELDSQEYDASLQLKVIPLTYADARSVAQAINEAFQGRIERDRGGDRQARDRTARGRDDERREPITPTVLVEAEEWVRASAERQTNSVIVSASRQNIRKIEQIVEQLDVADYAKLPAPRLIAVKSGDPEQIAESLNQLYEQEGDARGRKGLRIVGDSASNTIIVRAEDDEFDQIRALADAIQQSASQGGIAVHVIPLEAAPARRVAEAIAAAYQEKAEQTNQALSIEVDTTGNNIIVACAAPLFEEIEATVKQLDALSPAAGQGIFIIELEHISPDAAKEIIETIGLDEPQRDDSVSRLITEPVRVSLLAGRNAIIVIANPADRDTLIGLVKAIDAEPRLAEAQVRLIRLRRAEASAVEDLLRDVLSPSEQQAETPIARAVQEQVRRLAVRRDGLDEPDVTLDLTKPIRIIAAENLNAVLVSSTEANVTAVVELIRMFDRLPITEGVMVQLYPLENIAAEQFAAIVRDLFDQGKDLGRIPGTDIDAVPGGMVGEALLDEIAITVDERTNTVVVAGREDAVAMVEVLTQRLDSDVAVGWIEPRVIQLRHADAADLAATLEAIIVEGSQNLPQSTPLQRQIGRLRMARLEENGGQVLEADVFQPMTRLVIRPEPQLNALVLVGTPMNLELVSELVAMLDVEAASPDATVRIYPVENASATRLASILTQLFDQQVRSKAIRPEDRVIVEADERTNALIVTTSPRSFAVMEGLLETLDSEVAPDLREIRRIELENASATRLARLIQQMMDARLDRLRKIQPETADLERATVLPDERTNSLLVAAGNESFEVIQQLASDLDRTTLDDESLVKVIALEKGIADRLTETINAVMERRYADMPSDLRESQRPLVLTDPRSNSLLVSANAEDLEAIERLVAQLEATPSDPAVGLHVVELPDTSSAERLAPQLQRLMRERQQSLGDARRPSDRVTVEPDIASNTLIVAASAENLEIVRGLVDVLVEAGEEAVAGRIFEVIPLRSSRATDVMPLLEDLFLKEARATRGDNVVQVTADERINAVLVNAPPADVEMIRGLVAQLDGAKPASVVEIKYIPLESANALETVSLIENVLSGRGIGARRGREQATVLKYLHELAEERERETGERPTEMEVSAAIRESIVLTPDLRTNTIIVSAPSQSMKMIERMISDLDSTATGSKTVRIFTLVNADAEAMAEIITDLFNLRQGNNLLVLKPRGMGEREPEGPDVAPDPNALPVGLSGTELTAVPDERQQLSITVDSRTNSLLVSGTPTYLDLVSKVVEELDSVEANERERFVYALRNATAADVASVLTEFVEQEQQTLMETFARDEARLGSLSRLLEREITIQGDEKSNTVLVSASPRYIDKVKDLIKQLDVDPPQVLIQVMLAEITLDSSDEWGVDFELRSDLDGTAITAGFGLASAFVTGTGVPNLAVSATDFDLLIRAIQSQGRLQVLSNPSIMAANNEQARIQVGETIQVAEATSFTDAGNTNTSLIEREIGVILQVTPSINPDGYVRMTVEPTISALSDRTTAINEDLQSPIITIRTASTTVTVHDGQTIVIGGLISDRYERRDNKVPFFGDIPLFGLLFRSEVETTARTELLIVLTPHVIQSPTEFGGRIDELTGRAVERITVPRKIRDAIRRGEFELGDGLFDAEGNPINFDETRNEPNQLEDGSQE